MIPTPLRPPARHNPSQPTGRRWGRLLGLLLLLLWGVPAMANLYLEGQSTSVELAGHLERLEGDAGNLGIEQVARGLAGPFQPLSGHLVAGFGPGRTTWLRFSVTATDTTEWRLRILPTYLDSAELYLPSATGWRQLSGGDMRPFNQRAIDDRAVVFPLELPLGEPYTLYLRLRHDGNFNAYLSLHTPAAHQRLLVREGMLFGLYFGTITVLLAINLLHFATLRELLFAEFSFYLALRWFFFFSYDGLLFQYLLPDHPLLVRDILRLALTLTVASISLVQVRVFDMPRFYPRLARLCWGLGAIATAIALSVFTGYFARLGEILSLIVLLLNLAGIIAAINHLRQRRPLGGLLLVTILLQVTGLALTALSGLGIHTSLTADLYGSQLASVATVLTLHFAVAIRVLEIKQAQTTSERAAQQAAELAQRERAARREQADFVAMLFHEIKTPLAEIESATSVLEQLDDGRCQATGPRYDTIHGAVERLNQLVEHSLARDRQGLEQVHLVRRPLDLAQLARAVQETFRGRHSHALLLEIKGPLPLVWGDPEYLRVALANLIDNALKYAPTGSEVSIELQAEQEGVTIAVGDQGIGMDDETLSRAFDRYWRGRGIGATGAGLGLYLVRRILEAHGGSVRVESSPGQGSRFTLIVPQEAQ